MNVHPFEFPEKVNLQKSLEAECRAPAIVTP